MQLERPIGIAFAGLAIALVAPEYITLSRPDAASPSTALVLGAVLGALGVYVGSIMAAERVTRSTRVLAFGFWILLAFALSGALFLAVAQSHTWGYRLLFGLGGLLPLVGPVAVLAGKRPG